MGASLGNVLEYRNDVTQDLEEFRSRNQSGKWSDKDYRESPLRSDYLAKAGAYELMGHINEALRYGNSEAGTEEQVLFEARYRFSEMFTAVAMSAPQAMFQTWNELAPRGDILSEIRRLGGRLCAPETLAGSLATPFMQPKEVSEEGDYIMVVPAERVSEMKELFLTFLKYLEASECNYASDRGDLSSVEVTAPE